MSDLPQQNTIVQYVADGSEDEYVFAFYVPEDPDIEVYVTLEDETPVPEDDIKVLNVDYTVTQNSDPVTGGFITFLTGKIPPNGATVTLNRNVLASLNVEFANAQNFSGANLDTALDRLLLICQQNKSYALERNLSYRINSYLPSIESNTQLQPLLPNYIWMGAADGGVIAVELEEDPDVSTLRSELANNSPGTDGARLVGYYDASSGGLGATTVRAYLASLPAYIQDIVQDNKQIYGVDSGAVNTLTAALTPVLPAYVAGQIFLIRPNNTNTASSTLNLNGLGAKSIILLNGLPIQAGDILQHVNAIFTYDGTNMQLLNPQTMLYRKFAGTSMNMSGSLSIGALSTSRLPFNTIIFDTNSWCDTVAGRVVPNIAGYIRVSASVLIHDVGGISIQGDASISVYKNSSYFIDLSGFPLTGFSGWACGSAIIPVNGTTDYVEIFGSNQSNAHALTFGAESIFQVEFIGT
jgi:hypothetical protein